jgi:uncharacterized caspase-like protein
MLLRSILLVVLALAATVSASAETAKKFALLIGNQAYTNAVGPLENPHNDIRLVGDALRRVGFDVVEVKDAGYRRMDTEVKRHVMKVRRAGTNAISFIYYSGHGIANPDTKANYLVPTDVTSADSDDLWLHSFEQSQIIDRLRRRAPNATHYVVFDACRNELNLTGSAASGFKSLGSQKGFQPIQNTSGILIAYATAPGQTASDAGVGGGAYAKALAAELQRPGVEAVTMFRRVQLRVKRAIGQDPWLSIPTLPEVFLAGRHVSADTKSLEAARSRIQAEIEALEAKRRREALVLEEARRRAQNLVDARRREEERRRQGAAARAAQATICFVDDVRPPDDWLALRTHPTSRSGRQLAKLPKGTRLELLGERNGAWIKVRAWSQEGWVSWQRQRWIRCP